MKDAQKVTFKVESPHLIKIDGIGPIMLERSRRAKHVNISVTPSRGVRVAVPLRISFHEALQFVYSKKPWIQAHLERHRRYDKERKAVAESSSSIDKAKAKTILMRRLGQLAEKHGFHYGKVSIRNQRTRWGSCSRKNNISLNIKLVLLPETLADYVILHELVHTRKKDHSKSFWAELDGYVGNGKAMSSALRKHGGSLL